MEAGIECVATCRPGLEGVLSAEIEQLEGRNVRPGKRSVYFSTDRAGIYRMNMALRTAIQILIPIRTFNARDYQLLYYQARRTNWHQLFTPDKTVRIDVNGSSQTLRNTQYVIHRVKDGIVDTFRKLADGVRPSIDKSEPEVHVVVHLHGNEVTLCLDSSGIPLFKRGYRVEHTGAPIKEDLAAGMLLLAGLAERNTLVDPMCGSGTFLFEGYMILKGMAPNLHRSFAFQNWLDYDPEIYLQEFTQLKEKALARKEIRIFGSDRDPEAIALAGRILAESFPEAPIELLESSLQDLTEARPGALLVTNPPYGNRMGEEDDLIQLYRDLGDAAKRMVPGGRLGFFTTNRKAARQIRMKADQSLTLFNGQLEGVFYLYEVRENSAEEG